MGHKKNLDRLVRIGWDWAPKRVQAFKANKVGQSLMPNLRLPIILDDEQFSEYRRALSGMTGQSEKALATVRSLPAADSGDGSFGSGGVYWAPMAGF